MIYAARRTGSRTSDGARAALRLAKDDRATGGPCWMDPTAVVD